MTRTPGDRIAQIEAENRALRAALADTIWQPIETAPQDGTSFLALIVADGEIDAVEWVSWFPKSDENHRFMNANSFNYFRWDYAKKFTHWMPLPEPPTTTERTTP